MIRTLLLFLLGCPLLGLSQPVWDTLPFRLNSTPRFFYEDTTEDWLYLGGNFWKVDGVSSNYLIRTDGQGYETPAFNSKGNPIVLPQTPLWATEYQNRLIIGGLGVISWDRQDDWQWEDYYEALTWTATHFGDSLVVGGRFREIAGNDVGAAAVWDGRNWTDFYDLHKNLPNSVYAINTITRYKGEIYVGGKFWEPNGLLSVARWDGQQWRAVGGGLPSPMGGVRDLVVYKGELYAGGLFNPSPGGAPAAHLVRWDGQQWRDVGGSITKGSVVADLFIHQDQLWVAGTFEEVGGIPAPGLARWDGSRWYGLGAEAPDRTWLLGSFRDTLYTCVKIQDGAFALVRLLQPAYYDTASVPMTTPLEAPLPVSDRLYPNPTPGLLTWDFGTPYTGAVSLWDIQGRQLAQQALRGRRQVVWDLSAYPPGLYLLRRDDGRVAKVLRE